MLSVEIAPIDYRDGNEHNNARKIPRLSKYADVTLERGMTDATVLGDWVDERSRRSVRHDR